MFCMNSPESAVSACHSSICDNHGASDSSVRALDGRRFDEEARFFAGEADAFGARGWKTAERAARLHVTSRLNALSLLPTAAKAGKLAEGGKKLLGHTFRKF